MRNLRSPLPLILAIVLAVAVAAGAAAIGFRFAGAGSAISTSATTLPIIAPSSHGAIKDASQLTSPPVGTERVAAPIADPRAAFRSFLHRIGAGVTGVHTGSGTGTVADLPAPPAGTGTPAGDPCSPPSGSPPAGCPAGVTGAIYADLHDRPLAVAPEAFPPTLADYVAHGNPYGAIYCPVDSTSVNHDVPIGVMTTVPVAHIAVTYWPARHPEAALTTSFATTDADATAHTAARGRATSDADIPVVQNCSLLHDTRSNTAYEGSVSATDSFGETVYATLYFNSSGTPTVPTVRVLTVGDNGLIVQASHRDDQTAESRVYASNSPSLGSCDAPTAPELPGYDLAETAYTTEQLNAFNQDIRYDRVQQSYILVPEGTHLLVCERLFAGRTAPSWTRTAPQFESSILVESPDRINPLISVNGVTGTPSGLAGRITAQTAEGEECPDEVRFAASGLFRVPQTLCGPDVTSGAGTRLEGAALAAVGFSGNFAIRVTASWGSHTNELIGAQALDLHEGLCRGDCALPIDDHYTTQLSDSAHNHLGSVGIVVTWHAGNTDGDRDWVIGSATAITPITQAPARPQLNADTEFELDHTNPVDHTDTMIYRLSTDRPVTYSLTLAGNGGPMCTVASSVTTATGSTVAGTLASNTATIRLADLCAGVSYSATIVLVDAAGHRAVWGLGGATDVWAPSSIIITPGVPVRIHYTFNAFGNERSFVDDLDMNWSGIDARLVNTRGGACSSDGVVFDTGFIDADAPTEGTLSARVRISPSDSFSPLDCARNVHTSAVSTISTDLTLAQLLGYDGVTIRSSDGAIVIRMWATLRHG